MTVSKTAFLATTSAIALMAAGPILASQSTSASAGTQIADTTHMENQAKIKVEAGSLPGKPLQDSNGQTIGEIESVIVDGSGHIVALVVSSGGYLGMGERDLAIDWNLIDLADNGNIVKANLTKAQVESLPEYKFTDEANRKKSFHDKEFIDQMQSGKSFKGPGKTSSGTNQ